MIWVRYSGSWQRFRRYSDRPHTYPDAHPRIRPMLQIALYSVFRGKTWSVQHARLQHTLFPHAHCMCRRVIAWSGSRTPLHRGTGGSVTSKLLRFPPILRSHRMHSCTLLELLNNVPWLGGG